MSKKFYRVIHVVESACIAISAAEAERIVRHAMETRKNDYAVSITHTETFLQGGKR
jgi:hypothetical protein